MDPNDEGPIPREIRALRARVAELEDAIRHLLDHASDEGWRDAALHAGALIPAKR